MRPRQFLVTISKWGVDLKEYGTWGLLHELGKADAMLTWSLEDFPKALDYLRRNLGHAILEAKHLREEVSE